MRTSQGTPPQAPEVGWLRRLLGPLHFTGVFWYRLHAGSLRILPSWAIWIVTAVFTLFFFFLLRRVRLAVAGNLEAVLGPCSWWESQRRVFRTLWNHAWCLTERYERQRPEGQIETVLENSQEWESMLTSQRGFVLATAHVGHWEAGSWVASDHGRRHVHVVREREMDPRAQAFLEQQLAAQATDAYTVHFADNEANFGTRLMFALRRGELVALQGDRPSAHGKTVQTHLFGLPFPLPAGAAALARAANAPIVPVFVFRDGRRRARVVFRQPIEADQNADRDQDVLNTTQRIATEIEWAIRQPPEQWFCFRRLWSRSLVRPTQDRSPRPTEETDPSPSNSGPRATLADPL